MMFTKGRRRKIHLAIIVTLSMLSMLFFQNCGGGIESQSSVLSSDTNSPQSTPNPTPGPAPAPAPPAPTPVTPGPGPVVLPQVPQSARDAYCAQFINTNAKALLSSPSASSLTLNSGNGNGTNGVGQDESGNNAVTMTYSVARGFVNPNNLPITNVQVTSLPGYTTGYATGVFNCDFATTISVSYIGAGQLGEQPNSITSGVIMNPGHPNYGQDIFAAGITRTQDQLATDVSNLPNAMSIAGFAATGSLTLGVQLDRNAPGDTSIGGLRCAQGHFWLRAGARSSVTATGGAATQTQAVNTFTAAEYQYVRVNVNNRCWNETKLVPPNSPVRSSRYGNFVSASANWMAVASEKDVGDDSGTSVTDSGTVTVFRRNQTTGALVMCAELTVAGATAFQAITSVSITEDSNQTPRLAIGNANYNNGQGRVTIMSNPTRTCGASNWQHVEHISPPAGSSGQLFGQAVVQTAGRLYVGSPGFDARKGGVFVFSCDVDSCNGGGGQYRYLIQNNRTLISGLDPIQSAFGMRLAVSGNMLAVGAPQHFATEQYGDGYVQIFNVVSDTAAPAPSYTIDAPNRPANGVEPRSGMRFGDSLDIDGNRLVVGAPFRMNTTNAESGSAHFYSNYTTNQTTPETKLGAGMSFYFGRSVGLSTNGYLVGCDGCATNEGRVFHYTPGNTSTASNSSTFTLFAQDKESPTTAFGYSMAVIGGNQVVVGAPTKPDPNVAGGSAYHYQIRTLMSGSAR